MKLLKSIHIEKSDRNIYMLTFNKAINDDNFQSIISMAEIQRLIDKQGYMFFDADNENEKMLSVIKRIEDRWPLDLTVPKLSINLTEN